MCECCIKKVRHFCGLVREIRFICSACIQDCDPKSSITSVDDTAD